VALPEQFSSERLRLRRPESSDAAAIFERYATDPEVTRFLSWPSHKSQDDTLAFLRFADAAWAAWGAGPLLIEDKDSDLLLGSTGVEFITSTRVSTGYVLAQDAWGKGYASEALQAVLDALSGSTVWRVGALCHTDHDLSAKVLEKAGFEREGVLRRHTVFPNLAPEPQDVIMFSRILW
jgi:RimJ/RimL family protein N-acetyltransferase